MTEKRNITPVGIMRGALQPVRFGELAGPVTDVYGDEHFADGDQVAIQFWGGGVTRVTKLNSHLSFPARTNTIRMYEPKHIELDFSGQAGDAPGLH